MRISAFLLITLLANPVVADTRDDVIAAIERAGTNDHEDRRHKVEINGCQMTTYVWQNEPDQGWILWSSFVFPMTDASTTPIAGDQSNAKAPEPGFGIIAFEMRDGTAARHERSVVRKPSKNKENKPSPRGDGKSHYYQPSTDFLILMQGPGTGQKARDFAASYERYVREYCTFSS